jgi:hypothetical protein
LFAFNANALRISRYEATYEVDHEFKNDQVVMYFGYRGEFAYTTTFEIEYDSTMLDLDRVVATENFTYENKEAVLSSNTKKQTVTFTGSMAFNDIQYGALVFKISKNYTVGTTTEVKVRNVISTDENGDKYRCEGYYISLKRETKNTVSAVRSEMNKETDQKRKIDSLLPFIIAGIAAVFLVMFIIILMPTGRHENRSKVVKSKVDPNNYPQPGVGPLPKFAQKKKRNIIKSEEETIQPLSQFVSKDKEVRKELMDKPLETDPNVFENNPTRKGKEGLININPLAFDDSTDDDDIDTLE